MPNSVSVSAPTGALTTRRPTIVWAASGFTPGGANIQIWVFPTANIGASPSGEEAVSPTVAGPWNWTGAVYSASTIPTGTNHTMESDLPFGVYRATVQAYGGAGVVWGTSPEFYFGDTLSAPTGLIPATGATVDTNLPLLQATLVGSLYGAQQRAEFQFATDAGFTTDVRTVTEALGDLRTSGLTTETVPTASKLFASANWRVRVRAKNAGDEVSAWSSANTFTVAHLPTATITSPANGVGLPWNGGAFTAGWTFSSTSSDMAQTAYQVIVEKVSDGSNVYDSGKVVSTATSATISGLSSALKGVQLRVKVRLWDSEDVVGGYSSIVVFTPHDAATVAVTDPTGTIATPAPLVEWTFTPSTGGVQAKYRVVITLDSDGSTVYDSGWQIGDDVEWQVPITSGLETGENYTTTVYTQDLAGVEASDTQTFATSWTPPAAPDFTVETSTYDTDGPVTILIDTTVVDANFAGWLVERRTVGTTAWTEVHTSTLTDAWVRVADYAALANTAQEWQVVQLANRFGVTLRTADADLTPQSATPAGTRYWLLTDDNTSVGDASAPAIALLAAATSMVLHVRGDSYTDELEQAMIPIAGRGRKVEYGTDFGVIGQLEALFVLRDGVTARTQREALEEFKASRTSALLRNPFGDVWSVAVADTALTRERAPSEFSRVTIPYTEVTS